ncbi:uncharacterized protein TNCV_4606431 [Trichonephila clavipes]|nr:uncharacterized protein TNCV_4606431 [Trichonephila clavipes]
MHKEKKKLAASPVKKVTKKKKNIVNSLSAIAKSPSEYKREYRARRKTLQNTLVILCLRDGNATETPPCAINYRALDRRYIKACYNCRQSLNRKSIPNLSKYNGFVYPEIPGHLSTLDLISERLISPRIPFMQIRRLRHVLGQFGILGDTCAYPKIFPFPCDCHSHYLLILPEIKNSATRNLLADPSRKDKRMLTTPLRK